ncbi:MAG: PaaI family thioesterase [Flavobacteriales bacterium]|nr:PaaI family thioesterase [Flavobacteriales bacterium]
MEFEVLDDQRKALFTQVIESMMPLHKFLDIKLLDVKLRFAKLKLPFKQELVGDPRTSRWHGGMIATLIDGACGAAAVTTLNGPEDQLASIDLRTDFLKASKPLDLIAEAHIVRNGHRSMVTKCIVYHEDMKDEDKIIAMGTVVLDVKRK